MSKLTHNILLSCIIIYKIDQITKNLFLILFLSNIFYKENYAY